MIKKKFLLPIGATAMLALGATFTPIAFAQSSTVISGSAAPGLSQFTDLGAAPSSATMSVLVYLKLHNTGELNQDIASHKTMTPAEFHANFDPTNDEYKAVINQLQHAGLTIAGTSDNNMVINVSGTVSQLESVFGTSIHEYKDANGNTFYANPSNYHVTGALGSLLAGASGLDQFAAPRPMLQSATTSTGDSLTPAPGQKHTTSSLFDGNNSVNIQNAYNFGPVYKSGLDGNGQTIAIVDANGNPNIQTDLQTYQKTVEAGAYGATDPLHLTVMTPSGMTQVDTKNKVQGQTAAGWGGEVDMDVELSHAAAPGAKILLVETPNAYNDLYMGVNKVINGHLANQMSLSFGGPEAAVPASEKTAVDQMFAQAAAEGINVFVSSGDWGDFTQPPFGLSSPDVSYPASDPNVVGVGGSSLFVGNGNTYQSEIEWGEQVTKVVTASGKTEPGFWWFGTGGGTSHVFAKPSWQTGVSGLGSTNMRQVPDVGYDSDPFTGFTLVMNGQVEGGWGGTSDAAPQWAAISALANEGYAQKHNGAALPYINPILYANGQNALHDVQHGNVNLTFTGSSGNTYYITMGSDTSLKATPGWDDTTGLGTPNVAKVVNELVNSK